MSRSNYTKKSAVADAMRRKIYADIDASTIPQELKALYLLATAVQIMNETVFRRIQHVFLENGITIGSNVLLDGLDDYCRTTKKASRQFFRKVEPQIAGATFDVGRDASEGAAVYDAFSEDCNELCRLVLLYLDRTDKNERWRDVFTLLRRMPSTGTFRDEDFTRYKMRKI